METLEQGVKYVQSLHKDTRKMLIASGVFIVIFEHIPHLFLMFLLLTLSK